MLVIEVQGSGQAPKTYSFTRHTLGLGREIPTLNIGRSNWSPDILVESAERIATLVERDGLLCMDNKPLEIPTIHLGGGATVAIVKFAPIMDPDFMTTEGEFLAMLRADRNDTGARLVYADVLEERGYLIRAEFLRVRVRGHLNERLEGDSGVWDRLFRKLTCAKRWREMV